MDLLETLSRLLPPIILIAQGLLAWGMWSLSKKFVSKEECRECQDEMRQSASQAVQKLAELEKAEAATQASRVTNADLSKIYDRINDVDRKVSEHGGQLSQVRRGLEIINQHLLEK